MRSTATLLKSAITDNDNIWVHTHSKLKEAFLLMDRNQKGVIVVLQDMKPMGILTERDAVRLLAAGVDLATDSDRYAKKNVIVASGKRPVSYALNLMIENNIRRLVVVDDNSLFLGIVTQHDLLKYVEADFYRSTLKVKHILERIKNLISATLGETIKSVLQKMVKNNVSAVPILSNSRAVGIITEKDILKLANQGVSFDEPVDDHMTRPVITADFETSLEEIVKILNDRNIKRVVVNYADGLAAGVITGRDLVRNLEGGYSDYLERKLRYSKEVLNLMPEMIIELLDTGDEQLVVWANEKVLSRFGSGLTDHPVTDLVPPKRWDYIYQRLIDQGRVEDMRFKKNERFYEFCGFYLSMYTGTEKGRIQLILKDKTEEVMMSTMDTLTSIYNRRYINEFMVKEINRSKRTGRAFSVVIIDVDNFRSINDIYGHAAGDIVLKTVVKVMTDGIREYDTLGRYGGDEFIIVMPELKKKTVVGVMERIRGKVGESRIALPEGNEVGVSLSFGVACYGEDATSPDDLVLKAVERLYKAKQGGKNSIATS